MYIYDPHYNAELRELKLPEYNMNKFIDGYMIYVLEDSYKQNII